LPIDTHATFAEHGSLACYTFFKHSGAEAFPWLLASPSCRGCTRTGQNVRLRVPDGPCLGGAITVVDVFDLDRTLVADYASFARSFTQIRAQDIQDQVDAIYACRSPIETSPVSPIEMSRSSVCLRPVEVAWDDGASPAAARSTIRSMNYCRPARHPWHAATFLSVRNLDFSIGERHPRTNRDNSQKL
jgi:hypothetical protein